MPRKRQVTRNCLSALSSLLHILHLILSRCDKFPFARVTIIDALWWNWRFACKYAAVHTREKRCQAKPQSTLGRAQVAADRGAKTGKMRRNKTTLCLLLFLVAVTGCSKSPEAVQRDFFLGVQHWEPDEVLAALKSGAQINAPVGQLYSEIGARDPSQTALMYAIQNGRTEIVPLLLQHGADPNIFDRDGYTALHHAVERTYSAADMRVVNLLFKHGADVNARRIPGRRETALHRACDNMNIVLIKALLDKGADVNAQGDSKRTPLMIVAEKNASAVKLPILKLLLSKGADNKLRDEDNRSARDYALRRGHEQVALLLN